MNIIVCPTDFSEPATTAAYYAADMAKATKMSLGLLHVCQLPVTISEVPVPPYALDTAIAEAKQMMDDLRKKLLSRTGGTVMIYAEVRQGYFMSDLTDYCEKVNPYAVVIGSENAKGAERLLYGASTFSAITQLQWPVIVVPEAAVFSGIRKIGLACDLNDVVDTIPEREIELLVSTFKAELHVLHVSSSNTDFSPGEVAESGLLQELLSRLNPHYHFMKGDHTEKTIIDFVEQHDFDLLFIFPKHHNILESLFRHSRSKRMVTQSHIPVVALHETKS